MPTTNASAHPPPTTSYGSDAHEDVVAALEKGEGCCLVFAGAACKSKQEGVADLMERSAFNIYRFKVPQLVGERPVETQANLREAFDKASEESALLCFDDAEALFESLEEQDASEDALTSTSYFFQRVEAFPGAVLICVAGEVPLARVPENSIDLVVTF